MRNTFLLFILITAFGSLNTCAAQDQDPNRLADVVFVVSTNFADSLNNSSSDRRQERIFWLTGRYEASEVDDCQVELDIANDAPGMIEKLDSELDAKGVIPRYGLIVFGPDGVSYQSFQPAGDSPTPDDLWTGDFVEVERKLAEMWCEGTSTEGLIESNADGKYGQDAIMRVLGLQVIPGGTGEDCDDTTGGNQPPNDDDECNYGIEPAYEFRPVSKSIIFLSSSDTLVETTGNLNFPIPDLANQENTIDEVPDHKRRDIFHKRIQDRLAEDCIVFHSITPSLFAANAGQKANATPFEIENRSNFLANFQSDGWETDEQFLKPDGVVGTIETGTPGTPTRPLLLRIGADETVEVSGDEEDESYVRELAKNRLTEEGQISLLVNGWSLCSKFRSTSTYDDSGYAAFMFGSQVNLPLLEGDAGEDPREFSTAGAIEVEFFKDSESNKLLPTVLRYYDNYRNLELSSDIHIDPEQFSPADSIEIEIRAVNTFSDAFGGDLHVFLNGHAVTRGLSDDGRPIPLGWGPPGGGNINFIGIHSRDETEVVVVNNEDVTVVVEDGDAAFDYVDFYFQFNPPGIDEDIELDPLAQTTYDFDSTPLPYKEFFCNDFGTDGKQHDFGLYGISWRDIDNGNAFDDRTPIGLWQNLTPTSQFPKPYRVAENAEHVFSSDFENLNYIRLGEWTLGSAWSILPIVLEDERTDLNSGFTPTLIESISNTIFVNESAFEATIADRYIFYNDSSYDGNEPAPSTEDSGAIAIDKSPLFFGETATFDNYTSYWKGINGIMIDIDACVDLRASDFSFKLGNNDYPETWLDAPDPISISTEHGAGKDGTDRVKVIWENDLIERTWLEITIKKDRIGLREDDRFYFGNAVGESNSLRNNAAFVDADDITAVRNNLSGFFTVDLSSIHDHNRDKFVNAQDINIVRRNLSGFFPVRLITPKVTSGVVLQPAPKFGGKLNR